MDIFVALMMLVGSLLVLLFSCYRCFTEIKLLFTILNLGVFVRSGLRISLYILHYFVFLLSILLTVRVVCASKIVFTISGRRNRFEQKGASLPFRLDDSLFYSTLVTAADYLNLLSSVVGKSFLIVGPLYVLD